MCEIMLVMWQDRPSSEKLFVFIPGFLTETDVREPILDWYSAARRTSEKLEVNTAGFYWKSLSIDRLVDLKSKGAQKKLHNAWSLAKKEVKGASERLETFIEDASKKFEIYLVAHSLGCRVVLDFLKKTKCLDKIKGVFLFAAACTKEHLPTKRLDSLSDCVKVNAYSKSDFVLTKLYAAGESGFKISKEMGAHKILTQVMGYLSQEMPIGAGVDLESVAIQNVNIESVLGIKVGHMQYAHLVDQLLVKFLT